MTWAPEGLKATAHLQSRRITFLPTASKTCHTCRIKHRLKGVPCVSVSMWPPWVSVFTGFPHKTCQPFSRSGSKTLYLLLSTVTAKHQGKKIWPSGTDCQSDGFEKSLVCAEILKWKKSAAAIELLWDGDPELCIFIAIVLSLLCLLRSICRQPLLQQTLWKWNWIELNFLKPWRP